MAREYLNQANAASPTTAAPQNAFAVAEKAFGTAHALANRVIELSYRLGCGGDAGGVEPSDGPEPSGLLPQLDQRAEGATDALNRAHSALNRIEAALP